jgi:hypothetical protein
MCGAHAILVPAQAMSESVTMTTAFEIGGLPVPSTNVPPAKTVVWACAKLTAMHVSRMYAKPITNRRPFRCGCLGTLMVSAPASKDPEAYVASDNVHVSAAPHTIGGREGKAQRGHTPEFAAAAANVG